MAVSGHCAGSHATLAMSNFFFFVSGYHSCAHITVWAVQLSAVRSRSNLQWPLYSRAEQWSDLVE
jgi:hypothetical protein